MNSTTPGDFPDQPETIELLDRQAVCAYFGGTKPLALATLYRGVAIGIYPKSVNMSGGGSGASARWLAHECREALQRLIAKRDEPREKPERRGRPRKRQRIT